MSEAGLIAIVVAVLGLASSGGVWGYRQFKKESPVRQQDATIAAADKSVQMAIAVAAAANDNAAAADTRSKNFVEDLNTERTERKKLSDRVEILETTVKVQKTIIRVFDEAWDDLHTRWPYHRQQENPPPRPSAEDVTQAT